MTEITSLTNTFFKVASGQSRLAVLFSGRGFAAMRRVLNAIASFILW